MKAVGIAGLGLVAPGIESWESGSKRLMSDSPYDISAELPALKPSSLSANERRRTTETIKLALQCAQDAMLDQSMVQASDPYLTSVFASSSGDLNIVDKILSALTLPGKPVSPTQFHNSVHNAPAGYWSIATGSRAATTSIAAGDATFSVGLLEAMSQVVVDEHPVLLIAYDLVPPPVFLSQKQITASIGVAMLCSLSAGIKDRGATATTMNDAGFEQLRQANPAAQCLPLLQSIAQMQSATISLPYLHEQGLELRLQCND
jgi:hypothetical protein